MAITKETIIAAIEVVGQYKHVQVATDTVIKEDDTEISKTRHRHTLEPCAIDFSDNSKVETDISGEHADVQAVCNTVWTDAVKESYRKYLQDTKPPTSS